MFPPPRPTALAHPSVAHRRWRLHRMALALADRLADPGLWASGACWVRLDGAVVRPMAVVSDADPPVDGVVDVAEVRLVVQTDVPVEPAQWHAGGVDVTWRLSPRWAEVADAGGTRTLTVPCQLSAPVLTRPLPWPLPLEPAPRPGR